MITSYAAPSDSRRTSRRCPAPEPLAAFHLWASRPFPHHSVHRHRQPPVPPSCTGDDERSFTFPPSGTRIFPLSSLELRYFFYCVLVTKNYAVTAVSTLACFQKLTRSHSASRVYQWHRDFALAITPGFLGDSNPRLGYQGSIQLFRE